MSDIDLLVANAKRYNARSADPMVSNFIFPLFFVRFLFWFLGPLALVSLCLLGRLLSPYLPVMQHIVSRANHLLDSAETILAEADRKIFERAAEVTLHPRPVFPSLQPTLRAFRFHSSTSQARPFIDALSFRCFVSAARTIRIGAENLPAPLLAALLLHNR
jgi:hypothetical protein